MKLEEYVKQTLLDITNGVAAAKGTSEHTNKISFAVPIYFQAPTKVK